MAVPVNSIVVSFVVTCLLALINIGSTVAFNSISSLTLGGILSSYVISISCILRKRLVGEELLPSKFKLGHGFGIFLNVASLIFLVFMFVLSFFPPSVNPAPNLMNWNILIYGVVVIGSLLHYLFQGRYMYDGPVEYVRKGI